MGEEKVEKWMSGSAQRGVQGTYSSAVVGKARAGIMLGAAKGG